MGPFDRFDDRAKRALALAQDEAIRLGHDHLGPDHLLLGLVREGEGVAARALGSFGVELAALRREVGKRTPRGGASPREIALAPGTKRAIEAAVKESQRLGHPHVGTAHLLLGLMLTAPNDAEAHLRARGIEPDAVRERVSALLATEAAEPGSRPEWQQRASPPVRPSRAGPDRDRLPPPGVFHDTQGRKRDWYCEDVLSGRLAVDVLWEDERVLALRHPFPTRPVHALVIPKRHVASLLAPEALDPALLLSMLRGVQQAAFALGLEREGFSLVANAAAPGVTPHLHWHVHGPGPAGDEWSGRGSVPIPQPSGRPPTAG